ncbi:MAG: TolC family protein [Inhella sp.]|nr:TolC family protein [Inhella sp.]
MSRSVSVRRRARPARTLLALPAVPALLALFALFAPLEPAFGSSGMAPGPAQTSPPALTLAQAFERAWARQPEAQALGERREAVQAQQAAARRWTAEPAALELALRSDRLHQRQGAQELEFGVALPLWLPGEREHTRRLAEAQGLGVEAQAQLARWQLASTLREQWWALQQARVALQEAGERRQGAQQLAADVARRVQAGELSRADQLQADALGAAALADEALAAARAAASGEALRALLGLSADEPLRPAPEPEAEPEPDTPMDAQATPHPLLAALAARAGVARGAAALARTQTRAHPELTLQQSRERDGRGAPRSGSVLIGLRFPLGAGASQQAALAQTAAERIEAEQGLAREQERLAALQRGARTALQAARSALRHRSLQARLAVETREVLERSFRLGETDLPTRLRVEQEARSAIAERERARLDLHLAIAQLRQALGLLPQ